MESRELPLEPFELSLLPFLLLIALPPPLEKVAPSGAFFRFFIMYATAGGDFQIILTPNCDEFFVFWGEEKMMAEIHSTGPFVCKRPLYFTSAIGSLHRRRQYRESIDKLSRIA